MIKRCDSCMSENDKVSKVTMSSADWQRNEQRHLRREKRLIAIIVMLIIFFVGSNISWMYAWMQYDYESYEIVADGDSNANYIGEDGSIYNGGFDKSEKAEEKK